MRTPEGIGLYSTIEDFKAAYPDANQGDGGLIGARAPSTENSYDIGGGDDNEPVNWLVVSIPYGSSV